MIDCHGTREERFKARRLDTDTRWQEVRDEWIEDLSSAPYFLDEKGFRYYLPAIMIWELKHGGSSDSAAGDNVCSLLIAPPSTGIHIAVFDGGTRSGSRSMAPFRDKGLKWK